MLQESAEVIEQVHAATQETPLSDPFFPSALESLQETEESLIPHPDDVPYERHISISSTPLSAEDFESTKAQGPPVHSPSSSTAPSDLSLPAFEQSVMSQFPQFAAPVLSEVPSECETEDNAASMADLAQSLLSPTSPWGS